MPLFWRLCQASTFFQCYYKLSVISLFNVFFKYLVITSGNLYLPHSQCHDRQMDNSHFTRCFLVFTNCMMTNINWNLTEGLVCLFVQSGTHVGESRDMVSLVSQFLPTFLHRALTRRSLRSRYQSHTSVKFYTTAWRCNPQFFTSLPLTGVSHNPVFISARVLLSHEATV